MIDEREMRTSLVTGVKIDTLLATVLVSELLTPSEELWLVSPWISDVDVIDNTGGAFDSVFADPSNKIYSLSEVLGTLTWAGVRLGVVTRPDRHNETFLGRLDRCADPGNTRVIHEEKVHEKTFCGTDWQLTGSMNFTYRGMNVNDELVKYRVDSRVAATTRVEFAHRFGGKW
ncbi:phospholipase D-like domain-containing protein DpdK [Nocardia wallacei]|uniref:phospholipase D-like domain-containing protein DpdK n=1 Tax=Nocardia wallacei TaxID=480035 RepID=UPI0024579AAD|nr:phospholipase D-like domain-containing protein DpdK [Nocardia wallacei]